MPSEPEYTFGKSATTSALTQQSSNHFPLSNFWFCCPDDDEDEREIIVNDKSAMGWPPLWRAFSLIAESVAKLPINLYRSEDGARSRLKDTIQRENPLHKLLRYKPHPFMPAIPFKSTMQLHASRRGNAYAHIVFDDMMPKELEFIPWESCRPVYARDPDTDEWAIFYEVDLIDVDVLPAYLPYRTVFHYKGISDDGICGIDPLCLFDDEIALGIATVDQQLQFYKDGGVAGGILLFQKGTAKEKQQETMKYWKKIRSGRKAGTKVAKLMDGTTFQENSLGARNAQTIETREFQIAMAAAITGVPQHKLGGKRISSYNSLEEENRAWLNDTLDPWLCRWIEEATIKLMTPEQIESGLYFAFDTSRYERQSRKEMAEEGRLSVNDGLETANEWRERCNLPPIENGDRLRMPANIMFADQAGQEQMGAIQNVVRTQFGNAINRLSKVAMNASGSSDSWQTFCGSFTMKQGKPVNESVQAANDLLSSFKLDPIDDAAGMFFNELPKQYDRAKIETAINRAKSVIEEKIRAIGS